MPLIGDFSRIGGLQRSLKELASVPSRAARPASDALNVLIREGYDRGTDPYGRAWAPLAASTLARGRNPPPLTASRRMRDNTLANPLKGVGIGIRLPFPGIIHMGGSRRNLPARPPLPKGGRLPLAWRDAVNTAVTMAYRASFKGT
jgi:hypothetical protein